MDNGDAAVDDEAAAPAESAAVLENGDDSLDSNGDGENAGKSEGEEENTDDEEEEDEEVEEAERCFRLVSPHKMFIGRQSDPRASVSLTGMEFNPPTQTLMLTTKTVIGSSVTYAVSQLRPTAPGGGSKGGSGGGSLTNLRTRRYRASLEHHGDLRLASCGGNAPGELVCAGSDATGRRHGVFRLQALEATSQPVLAQCCGTTGDRLGQFNRPGGCTVDTTAGCVYVADRLNHRLQRLALPTLAPLGQLRHPRLFRPSHLAVFADPHHGVRLLLAAHERGVLAFDLLPAGDGEAATEAAAVAEFARGRARRWGGVCVHWGAVLLADQAENCIRLYRYRPDLHGSDGFGLVQRLPLAPLGLCLPRGLTAHRWLDLMFLAAHDTTGPGGGEVCVLTVQLVKTDQGCCWGGAPGEDAEQQQEAAATLA